MRLGAVSASPRGRVPFVLTKMAALGLSVVDSVRTHGGVGVICGPAGTGKTMILRAATAREEETVLLDVHPGWSAGALLRSLCLRLELPQVGSLHALSDAVIDALRKSDRLLLVDEAELLPVRALETLRRLHDLSGVGLVLAGTPRLLTRMKGSRQAPAQLYSRTGMVLDLSVTDDSDGGDFTAVLHAMSDTYGGPDSISAPLRDAYRTQADGNWRRLELLVRNSVRAARGGGCTLTPALVDACGQMLLR